MPKKNDTNSRHRHTSYPSVVYLQSAELSKITKRDHTYDVTDSHGHQNRTDTIAVLRESHTAARYTLAFERQFQLVDNINCPLIDFKMISNSGTVLFGPYTAPMIDTFSNLQTSFNAGTVKIIWDSDHQNAMTKEGGGYATQIGDLVHQFKARLPSDESAVLTRSSVNGLQLVKTANGNTFGSNWESMYDSDLGFIAGSSGSFFILWETDSTLPNLEIIAKLAGRFDFVLYGGKLQVRSSTNTYHPIINNILASTAYILEIQWTQNAATL